MTNGSPPYLPALVAERAQGPDRDGTYLEEIDGRTLSWAETNHEANAWAALLVSRGVAAGDRVLTMLPTTATSVCLWIGIARLGAIEVPVNTELVGPLLAHVVNDADPTVAVVAARFLDILLPELAGIEQLHVIVPDGADLPQADGVVFDTGTPSATHERFDRTIEPWDTAIVLYTSGTTGPSKGVIVPWGQMHETAAGSIPHDELGPDDAFYCPFGMAHVTARSGAQFTAMLGARLVLRQRFSGTDFWADVRQHRCTSTVLMGTMAHFLSRRPPEPDDATTPLRHVLMAPIIPEYEAFALRFDLQLCTVFNMTEVSVPIASNGYVIDGHQYCGYVRDGYECRVVDEHDREVADGEVGELVVRHRDPWKLMAGYWRNPGTTAEAWRNLWFHTGDAFSRDADGRFSFRDRFKDVIRRRGENISSVELETQANEHPDVLETAAVGVPSEFGEEDIMLFVVLNDGATPSPADIATYLSGRLPRYMVPRYVQVVGELPRTATQKLDKRTLRSGGVTTETWDRETH